MDCVTLAEFQCANRTLQTSSYLVTAQLPTTSHSQPQTEDCQESILPCDSHNIPAWISFSVHNRASSSDTVRRSFNFNVCDYGELARLLAEVDWGRVPAIEEINICVENFYEIVGSI